MTQEEKKIKRKENLEEAKDFGKELGKDLIHTALITAVTIGIGLLFKQNND